ncbi:hypothetical protein ACPEIC_13305 [Stenotrophomonas sp. NPDC087984]
MGTSELAALNLPVFARHITMVGTGKEHPDQFDVPVRVGGALVSRGDLAPVVFLHGLGSTKEDYVPWAGAGGVEAAPVLARSRRSRPERDARPSSGAVQPNSSVLM